MNIGFIKKTNNLYEFDCGDNIYVLEGYRMTSKLRLVNRKRQLNGDIFNEKQCQVDLEYNDPNNGIRFAHHINGTRIAKLAAYYNQQILEQIQQRYDKGGSKYIESERKIESL